MPLGYAFPITAVVASLWLLVHSDLYKLIAGIGSMVIVAPLYVLMTKKTSRNKK